MPVRMPGIILIRLKEASGELTGGFFQLLSFVILLD
jgi:hypothetical protein